MPRSVGVAVGIGALFLAGWNCAACSSSDRPGPAIGDGAAGHGGSSGGSGLNLAGNGDGPGNGPTLSDACAKKISTAQPTPLDMYIMLDVSTSMLDLTASQVSKWDAVKTAIESFIQDNDSAGLGVGLQYFPLQKPNAPTSCSSNDDCGDSGPCFLKFCFNSSNLYPCQQNSDCVTADGSNAGPCADIALCSKNQDYFCPNPNGKCEAADTTEDLGTCQRLTESVCQHTISCDVTQYSTPASPIATLPAAAAGLIASIDAQMPAGNTPTGPALAGAIKQASAWATANPDHRVVTVLATDGVPTECTPNAINQVAALAGDGVAATPSISTFVIGVFGPADVADGAPTNLNQIAIQGGTEKAFIVDTQKDVTSQFQTALDTIRGARLACKFPIPEPDAGDTLNYEQVNVTLTIGTQKNVVYYVEDAARCDATTGGWYYDVKPTATVSPSKILTCPSTCSAFQAAPSGASVGIALGCDRLVK